MNPEIYQPQVNPEGPVHEINNERREKSPTKLAKEPSPSRICGLNKRTALISLAALILAAATTAGGTAGGIIGARNKSVSSSTISHTCLLTLPLLTPSATQQNTPSPTDLLTTPSSSSSGTATGTTLGPSVAPAKAPSPLRTIAATRDEGGIFNFWQATTGDLGCMDTTPVPTPGKTLCD